MVKLNAYAPLFRDTVQCHEVVDDYWTAKAIWPNDQLKGAFEINEKRDLTPLGCTVHNGTKFIKKGTLEMMFFFILVTFSVQKCKFLGVFGLQFFKFKHFRVQKFNF